MCLFSKSLNLTIFYASFSFGEANLGTSLSNAIANVHSFTFLLQITVLRETVSWDFPPLVCESIKPTWTSETSQKKFSLLVLNSLLYSNLKFDCRCKGITAAMKKCWARSIFNDALYWLWIVYSHTGGSLFFIVSFWGKIALSKLRLNLSSRCMDWLSAD